MPKRHASNPRAQAQARQMRARYERAERQAEKRARKMIPTGDRPSDQIPAWLTCSACGARLDEHGLEAHECPQSEPRLPGPAPEAWEIPPDVTDVGEQIPSEGFTSI